MKPIEIIVELTGTRYSAYALDYALATVGANLDELKPSIVDALNLYFEETGGKPVTLDLPQFFEFYKEINVTALTKRIGMNQSLLAQYVFGKKKPSAQQVHRIQTSEALLLREVLRVGGGPFT